jgi:UDP-N-acetylmuramoyl-L-alanyl-D-glutamate--2,6-diaminopimelate ligase
MIALRELIYKAGIEELLGPPNPQVSDIHFDSRKVSKDDLFVAVKGTQTDGHFYIDLAIKQGAKVIICEVIPDSVQDKVTYAKVKDSAKALAVIASNFYRNPSEEIHLIGITGTNGKTTVATLLYQLFSDLGYGCGLISTIRNMVLEREDTASHTTPDPIRINHLLRQIADMGGNYCFMEVSSHAIVQQRIAGLQFKGGIFTNITHDHLDYHGTFKNYINAKKTFFDSLSNEAFAIVNSDDSNSKIMIQNCRANVTTYAVKSMADFTGKIIENQFEGLQMVIDGSEVFCRMTGAFNAYNLLAIYTCAILLGLEREDILLNISNMSPVEGRFDTIRSENGITGIVDYAHSPDAVKKVLETITGLRTRNEQLIIVIGAGGDRDKAKRPVMARLCSEKCDRLILTSDNPRSEDPEEVIKDMRSGISAENMKKVISITSREEAIRTACLMAKAGDIVLVAGKGHEKYQEIKGVKYPFDDAEILEDMLGVTNKKR